MNEPQRTPELCMIHSQAINDIGKNVTELKNELHETKESVIKIEQCIIGTTEKPGLVAHVRSCRDFRHAFTKALWIIGGVLITAATYGVAKVAF